MSIDSCAAHRAFVCLRSSYVFHHRIPFEWYASCCWNRANFAVTTVETAIKSDNSSDCMTNMRIRTIWFHDICARVCVCVCVLCGRVKRMSSKLRHLFPCQLPHKLVPRSVPWTKCQWTTASTHTAEVRNMEKHSKSIPLPESDKFWCVILCFPPMAKWCFFPSSVFGSGSSFSLSTTKIDYNRQLLNYSTTKRFFAVRQANHFSMLTLIFDNSAVLDCDEHSGVHTMACLFGCAYVLHVELSYLTLEILGGGVCTRRS